MEITYVWELPRGTETMCSLINNDQVHVMREEIRTKLTALISTTHQTGKTIWLDSISNIWGGHREHYHSDYSNILNLL